MIDQLYRDTEVAKILGLHVQTLRNWRHKGRGPTYRIINKRTVRYTAEDIQAYIENQPKAKPIM